MHLRLVALFAIVLVAGGCGGGDEASSERAPGCTAVEAPQPRKPEPRQAPTTEVNPELTQRAVVKTNCGEFTITLDPRSSPNAVASFATLANAGYYDDTTFHRIVPEFVIQGGDPTGTAGAVPATRPSTRRQRTPVHARNRRDGQDGGGAAGRRGQPVLRRHP